MPFIEPREMDSGQPYPGWHGRTWQSETMTFVEYAVDAGAEIPPHDHPQEEVWLVIAGELQISIAGEARTVGAAGVAIVPAGATHSVRAVTEARAVITYHPARPGFTMRRRAARAARMEQSTS
jgi:quercetin dioxygenase-like cupin family protein